MADQNGSTRRVVIAPSLAGSILDYFDWLRQNHPLPPLSGPTVQPPGSYGGSMGRDFPSPSLNGPPGQVSGGFGPAQAGAFPPSQPIASPPPGGQTGMPAGVNIGGGLTDKDVADTQVVRLPGQPSILCPPVPATITGVGPNQANSPKHNTAYTDTPGNAIPNGYVAINPEMFGVPRHNKKFQRDALAQTEIYPDWSAATPPNNYTPAIPNGIPSMGPYRVSDAYNPATQNVRVDLYRYASTQDANRSTLAGVPIRALIPDNGVLKCPPVPRR